MVRDELDELERMVGDHKDQVPDPQPRSGKGKGFRGPGRIARAAGAEIDDFDSPPSAR